MALLAPSFEIMTPMRFWAVCVCGGKAKAKLITRKPIEADTQELEENRRSRSAHLRVLEKC